jgi:hypothetical protein
VIVVSAKKPPRLKLYWYSTADGDEDWFVVSRGAREARRWVAAAEGYGTGDVEVELIIPLPTNLQGAGDGWPNRDVLLALGARFVRALSRRSAMHATNTVRDEFCNKIRRGIFSPVARHLCAGLVEDRMQEGIAQTFAMYRRHVEEKNDVLPDAILVHACGFRSRNLGRHLAVVTHSKRDAMDERNRTTAASRSFTSGASSKTTPRGTIRSPSGSRMRVRRIP